ncbi:hypothetical protein WN51_03068 [Melipona quadrifasciata]|uniref:Uncharacterized protein n=1 Tax=Melipona quadrifasciata TaxID=166423 RepID=A0A0M8ZY95_9HYME|nr:hypothetical protein WN51_03068 [Melipona quadrifasciata]
MVLSPTWSIIFPSLVARSFRIQGLESSKQYEYENGEARDEPNNNDGVPRSGIHSTGTMHVGQHAENVESSRHLLDFHGTIRLLFRNAKSGLYLEAHGSRYERIILNLRIWNMMERDEITFVCKLFNYHKVDAFSSHSVIASFALPTLLALDEGLPTILSIAFVLGPRETPRLTAITNAGGWVASYRDLVSSRPSRSSLCSLIFLSSETLRLVSDQKYYSTLALRRHQRGAVVQHCCAPTLAANPPAMGYRVISLRRPNLIVRVSFILVMMRVKCETLTKKKHFKKNDTSTIDSRRVSCLHFTAFSSKRHDGCDGKNAVDAARRTQAAHSYITIASSANKLYSVPSAHRRTSVGRQLRQNHKHSHDVDPGDSIGRATASLQGTGLSGLESGKTGMSRKKEKVCRGDRRSAVGWTASFRQAEDKSRYFKNTPYLHRCLRAKQLLRAKPEQLNTKTSRLANGYYGPAQKWKRPSRSILRVRSPANDKEYLAHDSMDREVCDMDQIRFLLVLFNAVPQSSAALAAGYHEEHHSFEVYRTR